MLFNSMANSVKGNVMCSFTLNQNKKYEFQLSTGIGKLPVLELVLYENRFVAKYTFKSDRNNKTFYFTNLSSRMH